MPLHTPHSVYFNRKPSLLCTNLGLVMLINQKGARALGLLTPTLSLSTHISTCRCTLWHGWWITTATCINEDFCDEEGNFSIDLVWCTEPTMDVHSPLLQKKMKLSWRKPPSTEIRATGRNDLGVKNTLKVCVTVFRNYWSLLLEYFGKLHWREHSSNTQGYEQDLKLVIIFLVFVHFYVNSYQCVSLWHFISHQARTVHYCIIMTFVHVPYNVTDYVCWRCNHDMYVMN